MSIVDEFNEELKKARPPCAFCAWLDSQEKSVREDVNKWLLNGGQAVVVWRVCSRRGMPYGETLVRRHRQKCLGL